ncbi:hypothetical protein G6F56_008292 [Rhizopus delemar]|nr:hypothetical protein G6F56_008292 [Rhizopus delemar]
MAPIELVSDTSETSCFGRLFSSVSNQSLPEINEKFDYSPVKPMYYNDDEEKKFTLMEQIINQKIESVSDRLYSISLDLHENFETGLKEVHAHSILTDFLEKEGFNVTRHAYGMETAFVAEYSRGSGRRIGVCAEYDGLPG